MECFKRFVLLFKKKPVPKPDPAPLEDIFEPVYDLYSDQVTTESSTQTIEPVEVRLAMDGDELCHLCKEALTTLERKQTIKRQKS